jgi:dephospho-CoA kinase
LTARFIGLTGGIGAGKSEALAAFERRGAATLSTDLVAHELLEDPGVLETLTARWGERVAPNGEVDRARVAERVFGDGDELAFLEGVLHPRVGERVLAWRQGLSPEVEVAVVEVPLLFEAGMEGAFDATVAIVADDGTRDRRLAERGAPGLEGRENRQLSQEEKAARADHVLRNDRTLEDLDLQVGALLSEFKGGSRP